MFRTDWWRQTKHNHLTRQHNSFTLMNSRAEFIQGTVPRPTWINTIDKHDSHKRDNFRHIDNQLIRQHNLFTRRGRDAETSWQQDTMTTTGTQARQEQGRVEKKRSQPCTQSTRYCKVPLSQLSTKGWNYPHLMNGISFGFNNFRALILPQPPQLPFRNNPNRSVVSPCYSIT